MVDRIIQMKKDDRLITEPPKVSIEKGDEECTSCIIVSSLCCSLVGIYLIRQSFAQNIKTRSVKYNAIALGTIMLSIAGIRVFTGFRLKDFIKNKFNQLLK